MSANNWSAPAARQVKASRATPLRCLRISARTPGRTEPGMERCPVTPIRVTEVKAGVAAVESVPACRVVAVPLVTREPPTAVGTTP
jgi:hypothetical protein